MKVLSLFDGISCGQIALQRAGIKVDKYYASEIDKYAIQITQKNYPSTIQLGDINNWKKWDIDWSNIDLVIGGSPCQGFSNAGKGLNFDDPRSRLFFVFKDILNHIKVQNPNVIFLLENVKMKKDWVNMISEYLGVEPIEINSSLVSAQNRQRLYWTNIHNITQPQNKGILIKDILEKDNYTTKFCNDKNMAHLLRPYGSKGQIITIETEKSPTLISAMGMGGGNGIYYAEKGNNENIFEVKNQTIIIYDKPYHIKLSDGLWKFRKLHPIECERLQTLPDNYTEGISNSQRYKCLGNGWTVDVVSWIFSFIPKEDNND